MNILHITNEFSKKNYSISSLIDHLSKKFNNSEKYKVNILTTSIDKQLFKDEKVAITPLLNWIDFFSNSKVSKKEINENDVIHVHGIWAPIQIFSIFYCNNIKSKSLIIHPHGMLLTEALKSAGFVKYLLKFFTLFIFKFILDDKITFFSITDQETLAIRKFFPSNKIVQIPNSIPFDLSIQSNKSLKKQFIYFGRIHPHKNLEILINSFIRANLGSEWYLKIYGIRDDEKYRQKIIELIDNNPNIKLYEPIFGEERQEIMSSSWANILISKSEVLSLSILESLYYGLPTLTSTNIDLKNLDDSVVKTNLNNQTIADNFKEISKWSISNRLKLSSEIKEKFSKIYKDFDLKTKYEDFYLDKAQINEIRESKDKEHIFTKLIKPKNLNFLVISGVYTFNLMFASLFVIILVLFKNFSTAGEVGLAASFWISVSQIFSSNIRSIAISENDRKLSSETLFYRLFFSIIIFSVAFFTFNNFTNFSNNNLIVSISGLVLFQWIFEMKLVKYEIENNLKKIYFLFLSNTVFLILILFCIFQSRLDLITTIIYVYIALFSVLIIPDIFSKNNFKNILSTIKINLNSVAFVSSMSIISSSFIWRLLIFAFFEKSIAGIFYACFSVGSFPGTLFNSVIGPTFVKKKITINKYLSLISKVFLIILLVSFFYSSYKIYYLYNLKSFNFLSINFVIFVTSISLIGSYFMSNAMFKRHKMIQEGLTERNELFFVDIIYGLSITMFVPILYFFGGVFATSFAFFVASIFAFIIYTKKSLKNYNKI